MSLTLTRIVALALVIGGITFGGAATVALMTNNSIIQQTRHEHCEVVDADHNRERRRIIESHQALYVLPEFKVLIASPAAERFAYELAKKRYIEVRDTRPGYCADFETNVVKPFPTLAEFQHGTADGSVPHPEK